MVPLIFKCGYDAPIRKQVKVVFSPTVNLREFIEKGVKTTKFGKNMYAFQFRHLKVSFVRRAGHVCLNLTFRQNFP